MHSLIPQALLIFQSNADFINTHSIVYLELITISQYVMVSIAQMKVSVLLCKSSVDSFHQSMVGLLLDTEHGAQSMGILQF